jgi:hypothetical protein
MSGGLFASIGERLTAAGCSRIFVAAIAFGLFSAIPNVGSNVGPTTTLRDSGNQN